MLSWSVLLVVLTALGLQVMPAPDVARPGHGGASIRGRVVDGATKALVAGARVRLNGSSQRGPVLTDEAGEFVFAALNGGTYSFVVERNGYLPTSWPDSSRWVRRADAPIRLAATDNLEGLTLAIERGGVVAGKVMSAAGEPISGAQLSLVGVVPPIYTTRNGMSNDLGDYRIADVPPGRYVLRAHLRTRQGLRSGTREHDLRGLHFGRDMHMDETRVLCGGLFDAGTAFSGLQWDFRAPRAALQSMTAPNAPSPFIADEALTWPNPSTGPRVRWRRPNHGQVMLDGYVLTVTAGPPVLSEGQHVIISAYFDETRGWWVPHGAFEVRDGRVLHLDKRWQTQDYDSVDDFAAALADPPPTKLSE